MIDIELVKVFVTKDHQVSIESLKKYITKKALSPAYDKEGKKELKEVANEFKAYLQKQIDDKLIDKINNLLVLDAASPLLYFSVEPTSAQTNPYTILLYGHLDKIPAAKEDLDAYTPQIIDNVLYGKGCANNGYAFFSIITAIKAIQAQETQKHPQIHVLIESSNESGSTDLKSYLDLLPIHPNMIICLDSEAPTYDNLWITTSSRGEIHFDLDAKVATRGIHCGKFGGIIPDSFMILKELFKRLETIEDQKVTYPLLEKAIPDETLATLTETATHLGKDYYKKLIPLEDNVHLLQQNTKDLYISNTYKPALFVTGQEGLPDLAHAGASLRPETKFRINIKVPPMGNVSEDCEKVKKTLTENPPFNSPITFSNSSMIQGVEFKKMPTKLFQCLKNLSSGVFNQQQPYLCSSGDTIPSALIFKESFPESTIILTGAAGITSNRYGLKENLDLKYWHAISTSLAVLISQFQDY